MPDQQETRLGQQIGEYRLVHKLGGGGFGTVYLAEHVHEHTQAAVKVLDIRLTKPENLKDFINEASTMRLRHPYIVPLLNFGISRDDLPFLVMEYAPQGTLRDHYAKGKCIPLPTIVSYTNQLASALQYAHDQRVIHRDVKPENILVRADGTLMVSDFGLAKLIEQSVLVSQQKLAGTPIYMAPEQHRGFPCFASDQYSLAVVIYEWISGVQPFKGTALGLAVQHMHNTPPSLLGYLPEGSEAVERVIFKALAKAPEDRFEHIQTFANALHEVVQPRPSTLAFNTLGQIPNTIPPISSEQISQPPFGPESEVLTPPTDSTGLKPNAQIEDAFVSGQRATSVFHSTQQDLLKSTVPPASQKRRPARRLRWVAGGILVLLLLSIVLVITIGPILSAKQGPSPTQTMQPNSTSVTPTHSDQIAQKWAFFAGSSVTSSPTIINGILYIGSWDHHMYAINANTGQQIWASSTGNPVVSSGTVFDGILYFGSNDHKVYAVDANTGQQKWVFSAGDSVSSSPTVANGVLYVGSIDSSVYALDANTGQQIWSFSTGAPVQSSPTLVNGVLYFGSWDHKVYALDAQTGQRRWAFPTGDAISSSPKVVNGVLYVGSYDSSVYAINASTGQQIWSFPTGDRVYSSPTVVNNVLYIGSEDHKVYALDINTGQQKWAFSTGDRVQSSPIVANGILYIGSFDKNVYGIDVNTGQQKWTFSTGDRLRSSPTVVNGILYIGSFDGKVYALTLPTSS